MDVFVGTKWEVVIGATAQAIGGNAAQFLLGAEEVAKVAATAEWLFGPCVQVRTNTKAQAALATTEATAKRNTFEADVNALVGVHSQVTASATKITTLEDNLRLAKNELQGKIDTVSGSLDAVNLSVNKCVLAETAARASAVQAVADDVAAIANKVQTLADQVDLAASKTDLTAVQTKLGEIETVIASLQVKV